MPSYFFFFFFVVVINSSVNVFILSCKIIFVTTKNRERALLLIKF